MISVKADTSTVDKLIHRKIGGMYELSSVRTFEAIAKVAFTLSADAFIRKTNLLASADRRSLHHVYEWGKAGNSRYRLYKLHRTAVKFGYLQVGYSFTKSKSVVPIAPELRVPGKNGRVVSKKFIFRDKASVMESGRATRPFSAKSAKALAIVGNNGTPIFIRKPRTIVISNPGGKATSKSFSKHFKKWFSTKSNVTNAVRASGYIEDLEKTVSRTLKRQGAGRREVSMAVNVLSAKYSKDKRFV
jgi:hypothetical protein